LVDREPKKKKGARNEKEKRQGSIGKKSASEKELVGDLKGYRNKSRILDIKHHKIIVVKKVSFFWEKHIVNS